jgi:hypothetical protein
MQTPLSAGIARAIAASLGLALACASAHAAAPLRLHPQNPHYFQFRGKPAILVGSGEHYGAVVNLDFNYTNYLDSIRRDGLNLTRTFVGAYVEPAGAFNIANNTLAPAPGRYLAPWARSATPGYAQGGNKFDLARWDGRYFRRLRDFVRKAAARGVVVEINLFCPFYDEAQWRLSPMNAINNVNGVGDVARTNVYTLDAHGGLLAVQESLVRRVVRALAPFDNVYYELCNEPYFGGVTLPWQHRIADVIVAADRPGGGAHLISRNVANGSERVQMPHPAISILNFHYAFPPDAVAANYDLGLAIGDNETGFAGTNDAPYRVEAWSFMLAGGSLFNHLDYSFATGHENGTFAFPGTQPGGGNPELRRQFRALKRFVESVDFVRMRPDATLVRAGVPSDMRAHVLSEPGTAAIAYFGPRERPKTEFASAPGALTMALTLELPAGGFQIEWVDVKTARTVRVRAVAGHRGGALHLQSPAFVGEIALRIRRVRAVM